MYKIRFNGLNVAVPTQLTNSGSLGSNVASVDIHNQQNKFLAVGNSGNIRNGTLSGNTITWTDASQNVIPAVITKVEAVKLNATPNLIAVGIDGSVWKAVGGVNDWYLRNSGTTNYFTSVAVDTLGRGLICGRSGKIFKVTNGETFSPAITGVSSPVSSNMTDVAIDWASSNAFITSESGQVVYMGTYIYPTAQLASAGTNGAANGVAFKSSGNAYIAGNSAFLSNYSGLNSVVNTNIFASSLSHLHFTDVNNGYLIDSSHVIRRTSNGGINWSVVLPDTTLPVLLRVFSPENGQALVVGDGNYGAVINGNSITQHLSFSGSSADFYDIDFNAANTSTGVIVGSRSTSYKVYAVSPTSYATSLIAQGIALSPAYKTVHVFRNSDFLTAGEGGLIKYCAGGTFYNQAGYTLAGGINSANISFRDIYFHDDYSGYVVGDSGAAIKCYLDDKISNIATTVNAIAWQQFCNQALYGAYGNAGIQKLIFHSIAFSSRTKGMIGGANNNFTMGSPFYSQKYATLISDEGGYYGTRFWYDKLGRLILSQNSKQYNKKNPDDNSVSQAFSYTLYDALGRITEVGEKYENHATILIPSPLKQKTIFGSNVDDNVFNPDVIDETKFLAWIGEAGRRADVTQTHYDRQSILPVSFATQNNLRRRVATVTFEDVRDIYDSTYQHATHYSYDIHGNVTTLWQENTSLTSINQHLKRTDYEFDLISGKVNKAVYQPDSADQFIHRYTYDADNRVTKVETSRDNIIYETDANYIYYAHGSLARIEYGKDHVQGMDYAYTLNGWVKGVNSNRLQASNDMGHDGDGIMMNPNAKFGRDAMGYTLGYFVGDYESIDYTNWNTASTRFEAYKAGTGYGSLIAGLYNGNIADMETTISSADTLVGAIPTEQTHYALGNIYKYDQLNRLKQAISYNSLDTSTSNIWSYPFTPDLYKNEFTYDANGNILTQTKYDSTGTIIDDLTYNYEMSGGKLKRNRLYHVNDAASSPGISDDIEDQGTFNSAPGTINQVNNYRYDETGNLTHDSIEEIDTIKWNADGKIRAIIRKTGSSKSNLVFDYDAQGNRIAKRVYTSGGAWISSTMYVRDAQGNVMSIYEHKPIPGPAVSYKQTELNVYGSSKLGTSYPDLEMIGALINLDTARIHLGNKQYEMSNHLGNILTTVSDKKIAVNDNTDSIIDYYVGDIISATDYYAFGQQLYGRRYNSNKVRAGFNGQEKTDEVSGSGNHTTAFFWEYDTRLGRRWNIDPMVKHWESPYAAFSDNPVLFRDPDGDDVINGDRLEANKKKVMMERANDKLSDFKTNHKIGDNTKKKDFIAKGGTKQDWKEYRSLRKEARNATREFHRWDERANITQGIIDQWKVSAPNLFNEVDKQSTDFILTSFDFDPGRDRAFGATTPEYSGDATNAQAPPSMGVRIAQQVNVSSIDPETGEYSLNHEAGHFLYIIKYTGEYVKYYIESNKKGTYVAGGHGTNDESGKVATKYGKLKDIPATPPIILQKGN
jgi:hypothetical protein